MEYVRICKHQNDKGKLVPVTDDIGKLHITDRNADWYKSIYYYNDEQFEQFKRVGTIAGITNVITPYLVWDFDDIENLERAQSDTLELCSRLLNYGVPKDQIQIFFSGSKGFTVQIHTDKRFTPEEFRRLNMTLAEGLETNDTSIYNASRILRYPATRHQKSGLYKIALSMEEATNPVEIIKEQAKTLENITVKPSQFRVIELPEAIYAKRLETKPMLVKKLDFDISQLDFSSKPAKLPSCIWAVMNGFFEEGQRSNALTALASRLKYQGYPKEITYNMLKGAARLQAQRTESEPFPKEEIWNKVVSQVFGPNWQGGQYSCRNQPWLKAICDSLGDHKCRHEADPAFVSITSMEEQFHNFTDNIEKNTIKTGIAPLDAKCQLTVGMPVALLGAPSSGKTSLALDILENTSKAGIHSAFFSMDMYGPLVYLKQIQRLTGLPIPEIHYIYKHDKKRAMDINEQIKERYKNVCFSLKPGQSSEEMRNALLDYQDRKGVPIKLSVVDYLELISGPYSDPTANTAKVATEQQAIATELGMCNMILVQPPKSAGDASEPLTSMRQIKGSSMLEQSFRVILGIYREGFGPNNPEDDRYMSIAALKNTMGGLFKIDMRWDGPRQMISELILGDEDDLNSIRERKKAERAQKAKDTAGW